MTNEIERLRKQLSDFGEMHDQEDKKAADEIGRLQRALLRQTENMAFVLNRVDLHNWHERYTLELEEDRKLL